MNKEPIYIIAILFVLEGLVHFIQDKAFEKLGLKDNWLKVFKSMIYTIPIWFALFYVTSVFNDNFEKIIYNEKKMMTVTEKQVNTYFEQSSRILKIAERQIDLYNYDKAFQRAVICKFLYSANHYPSQTEETFIKTHLEKDFPEMTIKQRDAILIEVKNY